MTEIRELLINRARLSIEMSLDRYLIGLKKLILLDYPDHSNVGDSAIYIGEINYFRMKTGLSPEFVSNCHFNNWDQLDFLDQDTPIFLHGGGNFGDMWPIHQLFRETILRRYPKRLVIQLPQSIHFSDPARALEAAQIINEHGNFVLLVRDAESYKFAKLNFDCDVSLCSDMAFFIGLENIKNKKPSQPLFLLRSDKESKHNFISDDFIRFINGKKADWLIDPHCIHAKSALTSIMNNIMKTSLSKNSYHIEFLKQKSLMRLNHGLKLINSSSFVVTDRLHAHILSVLSNIPHITLDNNYDKLRRFISCWTKDYSELSIISDFDHVKSWCMSMKNRISG